MNVTWLLGLFKSQDAAITNHKRAIRYHRRKLKHEAIKRDVISAQLKQLGIVVEQGAEEKTHGH